MNRILLIGDIMLDINYTGFCNRLANEAPLPIYKILSKKYLLGGVGNVANNLKSLKLDFILLSLVGNDEEGKIIKNILEEKEIKNNLFIDNRKTTTKNRIFIDNKLVSRFDNEDVFKYDYNNIINFLETNSFNYILISDYQKGFITKELYNYLKYYANKNNIKILCDPKDNNLDKYRNIYLLKPNKKEFEQLINKKCKSIDEITKEGIIFKKELNITRLYITLAEEGIIYINENNYYYYTPTNKSNVIDVTGAGDTILSLLIYLEINSIDENIIGNICNYIGLKSVSTVGNYTISLEDIHSYFIEQKVIKIKDLSNLITKLKKQNKKLVFTNGCFDIIHRGHIEYLKKSKKLGDILLVGLNSDNSIKMNKGNNRPYNKLEDRLYILEELYFIDYIVVFEDKTPKNIIDIIRPDIYTKGSEYSKDNICNVLGEELRDKIVLIDYLDGYSSSKYINLLDINK